MKMQPNRQARTCPLHLTVLLCAAGALDEELSESTAVWVTLPASQQPQHHVLAPSSSVMPRMLQKFWGWSSIDVCLWYISHNSNHHLFQTTNLSSVKPKHGMPVPGSLAFFNWILNSVHSGNVTYGRNGELLLHFPRPFSGVSLLKSDYLKLTLGLSRGLEATGN